MLSSEPVQLLHRVNRPPMPKHSTPVALATLLGLAAAGCVSSSEYPGVSGSGRHATSGAGGSTAASGATGGTGSTGGSTATGSASSSGSATSTGGVTCDSAWEDAWYDGGNLPVECPQGQVELKGRLTDVCHFNGIEAPPLLVAFSATDVFDKTLVATTEPCGVYYFCVNPGTEITAAFNAPSYFPFQAATLRMVRSTSEHGITNLLGLEMFCTLGITTITSSLNPALDPSKAVVDIGALGAAVSGPCDNTGWSFTLFDSDGGQLDPPTAYLVGTGSTAQNDGGTSAAGIEILYDIDPTVGPLTVVGHKLGADLPDGGSLCPDLSTVAPWEYTGQIPIQASTVSFLYYVL